MKQAAFALAVAAVSGCAAPKPPPAAPVARPVNAAPAEESDNYRGEEGFAVSGVMGTVEAEEVEAAFAARRAAVNDCYAQPSSDKAWLGGPLTLTLRIARSGDVAKVSITQPLGNLDVERCVAGVAKQMHIAKPKGGAEAEVSYGLTFRSRMTLQAWGNAEVGPVFEKNAAALAKCGDAPKGLRVAFFVTPGGRAPSVGLGADEPIDETYAACAVAEVGRWKFVDPRGTVARALYQF